MCVFAACPCAMVTMTLFTCVEFTIEQSSGCKFLRPYCQPSPLALYRCCACVCKSRYLLARAFAPPPAVFFSRLFLGQVPEREPLHRGRRPARSLRHIAVRARAVRKMGARVHSATSIHTQARQGAQGNQRHDAHWFCGGACLPERRRGMQHTRLL